MKAPDKNCKICGGTGKVYIPETQFGEEWVDDCICTEEDDDNSGATEGEER